MVQHPTRPDLPPLWFNLATAAGVAAIRYADGQMLEPEVVDVILEARAAEARVCRLQAGDVLLLDNYR
jgi:hypothetical protein